MAVLRELWEFIRTHRLKKRYRRGLLAVVAVIIVLIVGGVYVHAHVLQRAQPAAKRDRGPKQPSAAELAKRKQSLTTYFSQLAATGKVQLSYYSLAPKPGSAAAKHPQGFDHRGAWSVSADAEKAVLSASTYKLFITAYVFHRLEKDKLPWTLTDKANFDAMIINSDNGYAQTILTRYGKDKVDAYLKTLGIAPVFAGKSAETTVANLVKLLKLLDAGKGPYADAKLRARLLNDMGKQVYRNGIPAGVASVDKHATVQDKVGFLTQTNNDAGIVTTKDGHRYILVIMTTGHEQLDFSQIKTIAARTQQIVYSD
ncbi:serine hydrolase [Lacticaseibacillus sp. GG6-2]